MSAAFRPDPELIVGAGLAGMVAAAVWPNARLVEAAPGPQVGHAALLRFRSSVASALWGIHFRRVLVHKGLWWRGEMRAAAIDSANAYSNKVLRAGLVGDRSVWRLEPVERWVAPESLYAQLLERYAKRISWGARYDFAHHCRQPRSSLPLITTAPLAVAAAASGALSTELEASLASWAPIQVRRWRLPGADVFQTVYFPTHEHALYRASITGSLLIAEFVAGNASPPMNAAAGVVFSPTTVGSPSEPWHDELERAFQLRLATAEELPPVRQQYGKILPLPTEMRRAVLRRLTERHNIWSLGRFATWRNVLLDDVVADAMTIKDLASTDAYGQAVYFRSNNRKDPQQ